MTGCPFCQSEVEEKANSCSFCLAKKGYLKVDRLIAGKSLSVFLGLILPFMIVLYGISAQNLFGVYPSVGMALPVLAAMWHFILGAGWFKR